MFPIVQVRIVRAGVPVPAYQTEGASGFDLAPCVDGILLPGDSTAVPTGLFFEVPAGYELQVRPRGGTAIKRGITIINTPGTLDSDYRGELFLGLLNLGRSPFHWKVGDRLAQGVICPVMHAEFITVPSVEHFTPTKRGDGRFNSTGATQVPGPHANHGRGDAQSGPFEADCPCRGGPDQRACAMAGCGFCRAAEQRVTQVPGLNVSALPFCCSCRHVVPEEIGYKCALTGAHIEGIGNTRCDQWAGK